MGSFVYQNDVESLLRETSDTVVSTQLDKVKLARQREEHQKANAQMEATVYEKPLAARSNPTDFQDRIAVLFCRLMHKDPVFDPFLPYSQCPVCYRKYALPWAQPHEIGADVYRYNES
jgi:hypothetical protein